MSKALERLKHLLDYYYSTRGVGHTSLLLDAVKDTKDPCIVLTSTHSDSCFLKRISNENVRFVSLAELDNSKLRGVRFPMLVDNAAIFSLISEAVEEIDGLKSKLDRIKELAK